MRCKLHPQANAVGVCAPCLRDRLLAVAAERDHQAADDSSSPRQCQRDDASWAFPRSASPYAAAHRRSDACAYPAHQHQPSLRFFRTPQVGPAEAVTRRKVARGRRSFLAAIFGVGGRHAEEGHAKEKDPPRRSLSWLSAIVRRKRRPDASLQPDEEPPESSPGGGSSTTTTSWWFPSPSPARQHHHRRGAGASSGDGISGFAVCLSPLVRPGGRRRCPRPDPSALSLGDGHRRHASASFGRNTSRKLADMSRFR